MAIFGWLRRVRGQEAPRSHEDYFSKDVHHKTIKPTVFSVPGTSCSTTPFPETPNTAVGSPVGSEQTLVLAKLPEVFGRLASWRGSLILLFTSGSQFLDNVFMTSSNMALASIQEEFEVSSSNLQWMISAYTLTFGGFLLLAGALSDR